MVHERFSRLAAKVTLAEPPCMSEAQDWESQHAWMDELQPPPDTSSALPSIPEAPSKFPVRPQEGVMQACIVLTQLHTAVNGAARETVNDAALRRAWESSQRSTKEDWAEWMRHFSVELLKESPSPALRATHSLAQVLLLGGGGACVHPPAQAGISAAGQQAVTCIRAPSVSDRCSQPWRATCSRRAL